MKLSPRDAPGYFARPDPQRPGLLIYGQDAMRVSLRRRQVVAALIGPEGEAEMRLTRLPASDLRKDPAALDDAMRAQGFFPGPRVALVDEAGDGLAPVIGDALKAWQPGDAVLVVTAGQLAARSALRKLFEGHPAAYCAAIYDDPPSRAEIEGALSEAGLKQIDPAAMGALEGYARALNPGDFRQFVEKLALYCHGATGPVSVEDVETVAPASTEAALDDLLNVVAEARSNEIAPLLRRLQAQGVAPVTLCISAMRHFRALHAGASDPGGPGQGMSRLRPPVFGPRRDRMIRQAGNWGQARLEQAVAVITETDLTLRSSSRAPAWAVMERALIRLSMMARR